MKNILKSSIVVVLSVLCIIQSSCGTKTKIVIEKIDGEMHIVETQEIGGNDLTIPEMTPEEAARFELDNAVFQYPTDDGTLCYDVYDTYVAITGFTDTVKQSAYGRFANERHKYILNLPSYYNNLPVRVIEENAFSAYTMDKRLWIILGNVTLPETLYEICDGAFDNQASLKEIHIPDSVYWIGDNAFGARLVDYETPDVDVVIGKNVKTIGAGAFINISIINSLHLQNVEEIGNSAFDGCGLTSVTFGEKLTTIGPWAFNDNNLSEISFPETVERIEYYAFGNNKNLLNVFVHGHNTIINGYMSVPYSSRKEKFPVFAGCSSNLTIYGHPGSDVASYCSEFKHRFSVID